MTFDTELRLPGRISRLASLAYNLWWSWSPEARYLYRRIDRFVWERVEENPVLFLYTVDPERLQAASFDAEFLRAYDRVMTQFDAYMEPDANTWVSRNAPDLAGRNAAYFSAEFGLHRSLPIYSGGLGVLAGDHIKEASDLGLPLVAVSLLYRQGYLSQRLTADGWQQDVAPHLEPHSEPVIQMRSADGSPLLIDLALDDPGHPIKLAIWKVQVGRVPLFLLDADVEGNPDWTRMVASRLYGGDREHRLRQEIILGIGGVRALRALGYDPAYFHANEGHAAFSLLERLREHVVAGVPIAEAQRMVASTTVFTTHTPVPAGHDHFDAGMMDRYFGHFWPQLGIDRQTFFGLGAFAETGTDFNMTAISMRLADQRNGVSQKHGEVTREMWHSIWPALPVDQVPIIHVTNGVHLPTWITASIGRMLDEHLGPEWREEQANIDVWRGVRGIPDDVIWRAHSARKRRMLDVFSERSRQRWVQGGESGQVLSGGPFLEEKVLTLGFARRFATYKRATLLFHDPDRLAAILNDRDQPVQIVFAGKAHPADDGGKHMIRELIWRAR
ncbi:MAG TPA: alpha-glucan family phosphorylase, partial [Thermomicrobiales bacterium]|nr:alpha-glucan family phosphorylase [Thermomicrobiales bacterium]